MIDWKKPIETVNGTPCRVIRIGDDAYVEMLGSDYTDGDRRKGKDHKWWWFLDGSSASPEFLPALRNAVAAQDSTDELHQLRVFKAEALAAGYVPAVAVDPDLLEAREIVAATYQSLDEREWDSYADNLIAGKNDNDVEVKCALAGVRRGRELAAQEAGR